MVYINKTRGERFVETVDFFPEKFKLPILSTKELATQADKELTHALLHTQPAGPFCKVGDEQTSRVVIPPAETVGHDAPPRVQITVSPPRVQNTATPQRVEHQTTSSLLTQNSQRRTHNTHRREVTPPTPHAMVRRSAGQKHNLSQDMIAETVHQANHCLSFPPSPRTKNQKNVINNEQIIIMPVRKSMHRRACALERA
jgi:hypothetical protein